MAAAQAEVDVLRGSRSHSGVRRDNEDDRATRFLARTTATYAGHEYFLSGSTSRCTSRTIASTSASRLSRSSSTRSARYSTGMSWSSDDSTTATEA
ncbi:hypothetical protein WMF18_05050 [Sorangium sp. So ce315]|uniref:hypothetical protein n=1 Tax=Sorangium sp. So ce315 TaxID=3133299 RepID=UPI003F644F04